MRTRKSPNCASNNSFILFLFIILFSKSVNAESPNWSLISEFKTEDGENVYFFVDKSSIRFEKQTAIATIKFESSPKIAFMLTKFDCAKSTSEFLGGSSSEDGKKFKKEEPRKPEAAPAGTHVGRALAFVCELRPTWRKLLD